MAVPPAASVLALSIEMPMFEARILPLSRIEP
jgi:hypothetical protein